MTHRSWWWHGDLCRRRTGLGLNSEVGQTEELALLPEGCRHHRNKLSTYFVPVCVLNALCVTSPRPPHPLCPHRKALGRGGYPAFTPLSGWGNGRLVCSGWRQQPLLDPLQSARDSHPSSFPFLSHHRVQRLICPSVLQLRTDSPRLVSGASRLAFLD